LRDELNTRQMTLEGVISILEGMNPRILETKLNGFVERVSAEPGGGTRWRENESPST
jgi:chemotaxis protein MotA